MSRDSVVVLHNSGYADIAAAVPVSNATTFHGFSVTKPFTAVAILQLVEQGVLELDAPAVAYLPSFPYGADITVRQLLTHSAGLPNPMPLRWIHRASEHSTFDSDAFFRDIMRRNRKVKREPGVRFAYSNLGYVLLGQIVEAASGLSYEQYVTTHIIEPLGVPAGDLGFTIDNDRHARGHHRRRSVSYAALRFLIDRPTFVEPGSAEWAAFRPYYVNGAAYGGIIGTADGFAAFVQSLLDPDGPLLSSAMRRLLFAENILNGGKASGMALSWFKGELGGNAWYAHAGGGGGYYAEIRVYPELERGSVLLLNRTGMSDARFLDRIDRHLIVPR